MIEISLVLISCSDGTLGLKASVNFNVNMGIFQDLNRQVVQTNTATISIPELEFEAPPNKGGKITLKVQETFTLYWLKC